MTDTQKCVKSRCIYQKYSNITDYAIENDEYRSNDKPIVTELYNLERDPGEEINVADSYPEILEELLPLFKEARDDHSGHFILQD